MYSSCLAGPIIAKFGKFFAVINNLSNALVPSAASGLRTNAYLVVTLDNPKLFPFA